MSRTSSDGLGTSHLVARTRLWEALDRSVDTDVTVVSAPAGSGKTLLVRSWLEGIERPAAWVTVEPGERDPERFWRLVLRAVCEAADDVAADEPAPSPGGDGDALVGRLESALATLRTRLVLVVDDLHELRSPRALEQLERVVSQKPSALQIVLLTRSDPGLGLHRMRITGELTEIRTGDLRFTPEESRELVECSEVVLSDAGITLLHERTEGWAAGLRLAMLSLEGHPDPERFVAEFSGSERTVSGYLMAEVLAGQPEEVRRLLLRTSVLSRLSGPLADALTGGSGGERMLQALESSGAFVASLDTSRTWFRYHQLFRDLLRLELRRSAPAEVARLHVAAAEWHRDHGDIVEAIRHAQSAGAFQEASELLSEYFFTLSLDGRQADARELLAGFPSQWLSDDPELATVAAAEQLAEGSLTKAAAYVALAERDAASVPGSRKPRFDVSLSVTRLALARQRGDFATVLEQVSPLTSPWEPQTGFDIGTHDDLQALALFNLGAVERWSGRSESAARHLADGRELARRIGRPYVEVACLACWASATCRTSFAQASVAAQEAISIAEAHGWATDPVIAPAVVALGAALVHSGDFPAAQIWHDRGERLLRADVEPAESLALHTARAAMHLSAGALDQALAALRAAERLQAGLVTRHSLGLQVQCSMVQTLMLQGDPAAAQAVLDAMSDADRDQGETREVLAGGWLCAGDAQAALETLAPVLRGSVHTALDVRVRVLVFEGLARHRLGDESAAYDAIECALDLAEPERLILPFALTPGRDLLELHPRDRTAHGAFLAEILDVLSARTPRWSGDPVAPIADGLTGNELAVLRYLPSNLSLADIGAERYLSVNTVKTHVRHLYRKLGVNTRAGAVARARELGLLAPAAAQDTRFG